MPTIFFWKNWTLPYRSIFYALSGMFILSIILLWFFYFQGASGVIHWEKIQEQKIIETTVHQFRLGPFELTVPAESYVIFEYLQGSDLAHNTTASYIFLSILMLCALVMLTVITTLERFWFFAAMSLFILFVISLRLDVLMIFGLGNITMPVTVLVVFVITSFYFKSFRSQTSFIARLLTFIGLAGILSILIFLFAEIPFPMLHLAVTSYTAGIVLSILFIIMVAHEILASFVYVASQGTSKSLRHFLIISTIYMVNVIITCLHEIGYIQWDFFYLNLYLLLTISGILGLWGFKLRESLYENILSFAPFGAFFFIALGTICFVTIGQLLGNANDAALKVIRDIIIFTHTGFGIIFIMYFLSNFIAMMADNFSVYKVLYKPNRMPYFTFRLAGVIVTLAFIFISHWRDYVNYSVAGFYNYAADLYVMQDNETFGKAFYERSRINAYQNHRANYALAMMKSSRLDLEGALHNFEIANIAKPSDFSLVNEGNLHLWTKEYFPAIQSFRESEKIKSSAALAANLGFAYAKIHNLDSAIYYISDARNNVLTKSTAEANFFAITAAEYLPVKIDSILGIFDTKAPEVVSNALASATLFNQNLKIDIDPLATPALNLYSATLLNNYIIRNAQTLDTVFTAKAFQIADDSINATFSEALKASLAYAYYHQGNVYKAQEVLAELTFLTQSYQGKYNYIMGLWALEQNNPGIAHNYFTHAGDFAYKQARLYNAIALTEMGDHERSMIAWDSVLTYGDNSEKAIASRIKQILTLAPAQVLTLGDAEKYQFSRYMLSVNDTAYFSRLSNTFDDPNYKGQALLDMAKKQFDAGQIVQAIRYYNQTSGLELTDKKLYEDIRHFELRMLASRAETRKLATQINNGITFDASRSLEKMLYTAVISESNGDAKTAEKNYRILGSWNPYFEDGILAAATFYRNRNVTSPVPYNILAEAIQVNSNSIRLLEAYAAEAARQGFDDYAASAVQRLQELQQQRQ
jgi:hypothetical protein